MFQKKSVVLIGMPGVGKSTVGKILAQSLGYEFIDLDDQIIASFGEPLQQIIDRIGESEFLRIEEAAMVSTPTLKTVIAPGGSLVYNTTLVSNLKSKAVFVYLKDNPETILARIPNLESRGIIGMKNGGFMDLFREREPLYEAAADITINCENKTSDALAEEIEKKLP